MDRSPLGSLPSWVLEWTVSGAVLGAIGPALPVLVVVALEGRLGAFLPAILGIAAVAGGTGAVIAAITAPAARALATGLWRVSPVAALVLGPFVGAAGGAVLGGALAGWLDDGADTRAILALAGAACAGLTVGPTWLVYVALRARGRAGWAALAFAVGWAPLPIGATLSTAILLL